MRINVSNSLINDLKNLNNCPFCGTANILVRKTKEHNKIGYYIWCADCLAQGPIIGSCFGQKSEYEQVLDAIAGWNKRII